MLIVCFVSFDDKYAEKWFAFSCLGGSIIAIIVVIGMEYTCT